MNDFVERVRNNLIGKLDIKEGNCGTCHKILKEISDLGGKAMCWEKPDGIGAYIYDDKGNIVGTGEGITWPPAILFAQVEGGFLPKDIEKEITQSLLCIIDAEKVADIYGYGRVVTPVAAALTDIWKEGGRVTIRRNRWGIEVVFWDKDNKELGVGPISYCPTCGTATAITKVPELAEKIKNKLKGARNTGKEKYERKIENWFSYKNGRMLVELKENGEVIGKATGCCIAYTAVKAEVNAGIAGKKWGNLFKEYCKVCPVKLCQNKKNTGSVGNLLLTELEKKSMETEVYLGDYITALVKKDHEVVGKGIGTVCALSSILNAAAKSIELKSDLEIIR
ncbi:MAG: hypothetical protein ACE5KE_14385 [Methanosarcinales archaeon]